MEKLQESKACDNCDHCKPEAQCFWGMLKPSTAERFAAFCEEFPYEPECKIYDV